MKPFLMILSFLGTLPSHAAELSCRLPDAPPAFLDLVSQDRKVTIKEGEPQFTLTGVNRDSKAHIPKIFNNCRMTPVEITGKDPITGQPRIVQVLSYAQKGADPKKMRTVVLMPPTGGQNALDDWYANRLCDNNLRVVMVQHWTGDMINDHDFGSHDRGAMRAVAAVADVVEYIQPAKPAQLGILGTSVGAITSALALGVDARISTGALIVAGGGMGDIIGKSTEEHLARLREERMADPAMHLPTETDYVRAATENVKIEPLTFARFAKPKKVLSFMGTKDVTVPTANQRLLYQAFGSQELVTHDDNHLETIKHTYFNYRDKIASFFVDNLQEATDAEIAAAKQTVPRGNKLCRNANDAFRRQAAAGDAGLNEGDDTSAQ